MKCMNALFTQSWCSFKMIFNGRSKYTDAKCSNTQIHAQMLAPSLVYIYAMIVYFISPRSLFHYNIRFELHSYDCGCVCSGVLSLFSLLLSFSLLWQLFELILRRNGNTKSDVNATVNTFNVPLLSKRNQF